MDRRSVSIPHCSARGLQDKSKRKTVFNKILSSQYDIIFFQETQHTVDIDNTWDKD